MFYISFVINCNNLVRFLFAHGVWEQPVLHTEIWSRHHPVCLEWHVETEPTETDQIQKNCGNVFKMLQETYLQSYLKNDAQVHRGQKLL